MRVKIHYGDLPREYGDAVLASIGFSGSSVPRFYYSLYGVSVRGVGWRAIRVVWEHF